MAPPQTNPSTRRLSEVARHVVYPSGIVSTGWPSVETKCREFGDTFDEWQRGVGKLVLGKRADGVYASTVGGITLSIPRQVAKTFLVGRIVFALCVLFPGFKVLWTAHRTRTSTMTFKSLQGFARRKAVRPYLAEDRNDGIRTTNGEQEIRFRNGSVIMFGAREAGFGRGFDEVDVEVFDEAQILTEKALEDMVAATNQSRHTHGALLFFMGTPPRPVDPGEAFTLRREEALSGKSEDAVYIECSADEDADPDDREQWAIANPSFPHRTPVRSMLRLRKNLPSDESWRREALGIWDAQDDRRPGLNYDRWRSLAEPQAERAGIPSFGVATAPDRSWVAIAVAWRREDGDVQVMLTGDGDRLDYGRTTAWVEERAKELRNRWSGRLYPDTASAELIGDSEKPPPRAQVDARLDDLITAGRIHHGNQEAMNIAVRAAKWRESGEMRVLDRKGDTDITPVKAAALAVWGIDDGGVQFW